MSRDPFDFLEEHNPMPHDDLPPPPMGTANRIIDGSPRRRPLGGWALAAAAGAVVLIGGGAWLLWLGGGNGDVAAGSTSATPTTTASTTTVPEPTTTVTNPTTTTASPTTTTTQATWPVPDPSWFPIYLFLADNGTETAPGPYLVPKARTTAVMSAPVGDLHALALEFLIVAPTPGETEGVPTISSAIPEGTLLNGVTVAGGVATVDLSADFAGGGGSLSMMGRLAQVVLTMTAFEDVDGVRFLVDGVPTTVFGGEGIIVNDPSTRADWESLLPAVMIESPFHGGTGTNPLVVRGTANVFEATVSLALVDGRGLILWEGFATATCGTGCRGDWEAVIPYEIDEPQMGTVIAWETSAEDGRRTNVREHPVWLLPAGDEPPASEADRVRARLDQLRAELYWIHREITEQGNAWITADPGADRDTIEAAIDELRFEQGELRTEAYDALERLAELGEAFEAPCTGAAAPDVLPEEPGLPAAVASRRAALFEAAALCDWPALEALMPDDGFTSSFGLVDDPIAQWQREEALGYQPMAFLSSLLALPYGTLEAGDATYYVWPSAAALPWDQVSGTHRSALLGLYTEYDLWQFESFGGYVGHRIGITDEGTWVFFVAGD
jgi:spore germination protein GerM